MNRKSPARLDPRAPLVLSIRELGRRPGSMRRVSIPVPAPPGLGLELAGVPAGAPLELDLRLESVLEGVLVSGTVAAPVAGECARCLGAVADEVAADVQELFAYPDSATEQTSSADEVSRVEGDHLDLEPAVRDALVLALPLVPLCSPDCRGLCPTCGERLDDLPAEHGHDQVDLRWAALSNYDTHVDNAQEG